jgi:hypothetical protein
MPYKDPELKKQKEKERYEKNKINVIEKSTVWNKENKRARQVISMNYQWKTLGYKFGEKDFSYDDFDELFSEQKGRCANCKTHQADLNKTLSVDHCHETGQVRGLLCQRCNAILGMAKDNIEILKNSIEYLERKRWI